MKISKTKNRIILFVIVFAWVLVSFYEEIDSYFSDKSQLTRKIVTQLKENFEKKDEIRFAGIGWSTNIDELLKSNWVVFEIKGEKSQEDLRKLIIQISQTILNKINSTENIKPHLVNQKFKIPNLEISFFVRDKDNDSVYSPSIGRVNLFFGKIIYTIYDPDKEILTVKDEIEETYEEALKKVNENSI